MKSVLNQSECVLGVSFNEVSRFLILASYLVGSYCVFWNSLSSLSYDCVILFNYKIGPLLFGYSERKGDKY